MDQDRNCWGAREYADALNRAATPTELFELAQEVNEKWTAAGTLGVLTGAGTQLAGSHAESLPASPES